MSDSGESMDGSSVDTDAASDSGRIYEAVAARASARRLRALIDECARGSVERRKAAVNRPGPSGVTPLALAHDMRCGGLVGVLVESGADVRELYGGLATPLAVCLAHRRPQSVRALLRAGEDPNGTFRFNPACGFCPRCGFGVTAAHLCLVPPIQGRAPQLEALGILARNGADVNARDELGRTPLSWLADAARDHEAALECLLRLGADADAQAPAPEEDGDCPQNTPLIDLLQRAPRLASWVVPCARTLVARGARASRIFNALGRSPLAAAVASANVAAVRFLLEEARVPVDERNPVTEATALHGCASPSYVAERDAICELLLDAGADVDATDAAGRTPLWWSAKSLYRSTLLLLLKRGASPDVIDRDGCSSLAAAVGDLPTYSPCRDAVEELLRLSSPETLRATRCLDGRSALDALVRFSGNPAALRPWCPWRRKVASVMLALGVPVLPGHAAHVLPVAAARADASLAELAAWHAELGSWRGRETFVGVALDFAELRAAERGVEERRRRLLGAAGGTGRGGGGDDEGEGEG